MAYVDHIYFARGVENDKPSSVCSALLLDHQSKLGMVAQVCNPGTQEAKAGRSRSSSKTQQAQGQSELHEILLQKETK